MDAMQLAITLLGVVLGSGLIQFFFNRKDKKEEDAKGEKFKELREEFKKDLEEKEKLSKNRYDEHHKSIEKMSQQHEKDFQTLLDAIKKLGDNDKKVTECIEKISEKQDYVASGIMGLSHDKLVWMTDKIAERGVITLKEKATLESIYEPYTNLDGNGDAKVGYNHVMQFEVVSDEEARRLDKEILSFGKHKSEDNNHQDKRYSKDDRKARSN